jgi:hypothetical protein
MTAVGGVAIEKTSSPSPRLNERKWCRRIAVPCSDKVHILGGMPEELWKPKQGNEEL